MSREAGIRVRHEDNLVAKHQYVFAMADAATRFPGTTLNLIVNACVFHRKPLLILLVGGSLGRQGEIYDP